jgi:hypothetical protein
MIRTALIILAIEILVIGLVRRNASRARDDLGPPSPRSGYGEVSPRRA